MHAQMDKWVTFLFSPRKRFMTSEPVVEDCDVCMEEAKHGTIVHCFACTLKTCVPCTSSFLCMSKEDPHCMQCKRPWSAAFIARCGMPKDFVQKVMRPFREQVLWDREQALLPGTQQLAQAIREVRAASAEDDHEILQNARAKVKRLEAGLPPEGGAVHLVQRCPICPGFVSGTDFRCGMCDALLCRRCRCHIPKAMEDADSHVCDPGTLATVAQLAADTRPCPTCAAPIFRMYGCDQMFCTVCHTAFLWSTGTVDTGRVHNPHFFQTRRAHAGAGAGAGAGVPATVTAYAAGHMTAVNVGGAYAKLEKDLPSLCEVLPAGAPFPAARRLVVDLRATGKTERPQRDNAMLRASFLLHEIDEKEFKRRLFIGERARLRASDQGLVLDMFCTKVVRVLTDVVGAVSDTAMITSLKTALDTCRQECNVGLAAVSAYAGGRPFQIPEDFEALSR